MSILPNGSTNVTYGGVMTIVIALQSLTIAGFFAALQWHAIQPTHPDSASQRDLSNVYNQIARLESTIDNRFDKVDQRQTTMQDAQQKRFDLLLEEIRKLK
jgi:hypothetical protein